MRGKCTFQNLQFQSAVRPQLSFDIGVNRQVVFQMSLTNCMVYAATRETESSGSGRLQKACHILHKLDRQD
jgi:hypothetical protein